MSCLIIAFDLLASNLSCFFS